jgi:hypothetical protein
MRFTMRSARSPAVSIGFGSVIAVETFGLHLWLSQRHPILAWALTALSISSLAWLAGDFIALGRGFVDVGQDAIDVQAGWRATALIPRASITTAIRPTWRDIPAAGEPGARGYLSAVKPGDPNVLLSLSSAAPIRLMRAVRRDALLLGLQLDEPDAFISAVTARAPGAGGDQD